MVNPPPHWKKGFPSTPILSTVPVPPKEKEKKQNKAKQEQTDKKKKKHCQQESEI